MGKGSQKSTSTYRPDSQAYNLYSDLLTRAQGVAATPYNQFGGELVAPINAQQNTGISNLNTAAGAYQPYINNALGIAQQSAQPITAQQIQQYMSPYAQQVIDATQAQFANQNTQEQQRVLGNAAAQGALGGNRVGITQAALANQQQLAQAPVIAGLYNQGYGQALNTALTEQQMQQAGAANLGGLGIAGQNAGLQAAGAQIDAGSLQQKIQQAMDAAAYDQFLQQQAYPFQTTQWLAGIGTGVGSQMGGTNTTKQSAPSTGSQILGGISSFGGLLGQSGAFGTGGWMTSLLAGLKRGGGVMGYADGGGVGNREVPIPETDDTLLAQQDQLISGNRRAHMFTPGSMELPVPRGMSRLETENGVFHYNPQALDEDTINSAVADGRENELLDLGPFNKNDIMERLQRGEQPVAIVERTPQGVEVRAAAGTTQTAPVQLAAMSKTKSPGNTVSVERIQDVLGKRQGTDQVPARAAGGGLGVMPFSGGSGWVPNINLSAGHTMPQAPKLGQQSDNLSSQMKGIGDLAKGFSGVFSDLSWDGGTPLEGGLPIGMGGIGHAARGGAVGVVPNINFAAGGTPDFDGGLSIVPKDTLSFDDRFAGIPTADSFDDRFNGLKPLPPEPKVMPLGINTDMPVPSEGFGGEESVPTPQPRPVEALASADAPAPVAEAPASPPSGVAPTPRNLPRGLRNNNPGNIEDGDFARSQPGYVGSDGRFAIFADPRDGLAAQSTLLKSYGDRGINTINGIVNRWAPAADGNNTGAYVSAVSQKLGIAPDQPLNMNDPNVRIKVAEAMGQFENGVGGPGQDLDALAAKGYNRAAMGPTAVADNDSGVTSELSARNRGLAPPQQTGIDWGPNSKLWPALTMAGAAMLASKSPNFGVGLGEGLAAGMNTYAQLKGTEAEQRLNQQKLDLAAKKLSQEADHWEKDYAAKMMPYQGKMTKAQELQEARENRRQQLDEQKQTLEASKPFKIGSNFYGDIYGIRSKDGSIIPLDQRTGLPRYDAARPPGVSMEQPQGSPFRQQPPITNAGTPQNSPAARLIQTAEEPKLPGGMEPPPEADVRNQEVLDQIGKEDPHLGKLVKGLADYEINPNSLSIRGGHREKILALVKDYDPSYDQTLYNAKQRAVTEFFAGGNTSPAGILTNGNTAILHLGEMYDLVDKMHGQPGVISQGLDKAALAGIPFVSYVASQLRNAALKGTPEGAALTDFMTAKQRFTEEVTKFYSGSTGAEAERDRALKLLDEAKSPTELKSNIKTDLKLMRDKVEQMQGRLIGAMGPGTWKNAVKRDPNLVLTYKNSRDVSDRVLSGEADKGKPAAEHSAPPAANTAKVPVAQRFQQLIQSGVPEAEAYKRLKSEGY